MFVTPTIVLFSGCIGYEFFQTKCSTFAIFVLIWVKEAQFKNMLLGTLSTEKLSAVPNKVSGMGTCRECCPDVFLLPFLLIVDGPLAC